ncbi:uncharacterized protein LOC127462937 [Manacus candei]|uniref:uncharacterized protein LOC127462937 n=1 Tax=Manacus candei TaxID=415023 RepID=UPI0022261442|nr:uncharacterized protein LOC127462937 [Manacus candei]
MPNSPKPLLGRDLLEKLEAEIKFTKGGDIKVIIPDTKYVEAAAFFIQEKHGEIPAEVENAVIPLVWASEYPGKSKQAEPVSIALRPGAAPKLQKVIELSRPIGLDTPAHPFQPGDWVYVKWWNSDPLRAKWRGPYQVLLTSLTSVKVAGREPWFHYSRVKRASAPGTTNQTEPGTDDEDVE